MSPDGFHDKINMIRNFIFIVVTIIMLVIIINVALR